MRPLGFSLSRRIALTTEWALTHQPQASSFTKTRYIIPTLKGKSSRKRYSVAFRTPRYVWDTWVSCFGSHCVAHAKHLVIVPRHANMQTNPSFKLNNGSQRKFCTVLLKRQHKRLGLVLCIIPQSRQNNIENLFWSSSLNILCDSSSVINGNKIQVHSICSLRREWLFSIPKSIQKLCSFTWHITVI